MRKITLLILPFLIGTIACVKAQVDPHFSQIYANPLWLNPALTGAFDGNLRVNGNFKDQWAGVGNGYQTGAVSADFKQTEKVGIGINVVDQNAGTAGYNYFAVYGSFGYGIAISADGTKKLHFGLQVGFINRSFNPNSLQFDDQYSPTSGFNPNLPSGEIFSTTNSFIFDSGLGVYYYDTNTDNTLKLFGGVSVYHINGAADPFATAGAKTTLPVRFNIHGGVKIKASDELDITPNLIYIRQQQNQIRAIDIYSELKSNDDRGLILGAMYRINDAAVAEVGYHINGTIIGLSYDFNTSALTTATNGHGGIELSLNYIFNAHSGSTSNASPQF